MASMDASSHPSGDAFLSIAIVGAVGVIDRNSYFQCIGEEFSASRNTATSLPL
jgi:hypothetical protein